MRSESSCGLVGSAPATSPSPTAPPASVSTTPREPAIPPTTTAPSESTRFARERSSATRPSGIRAATSEPTELARWRTTHRNSADQQEGISDKESPTANPESLADRYQPSRSNSLRQSLPGGVDSRNGQCAHSHVDR